MNEDEIITGLRAKDRKTAEYLYDKYASSLYKVICKTLTDSKFSEEVLYFSFVKIIKNIKDYNLPKGHLYTWMAWICRKAALDMNRSNYFQLR